MKRLAIAALLVLAACDTDPRGPDEPRGVTDFFVIETPEGPIPCISWKSGYGGGLSCDWSHSA